MRMVCLFTPFELIATYYFLSVVSYLNLIEIIVEVYNQYMEDAVALILNIKFRVNSVFHSCNIGHFRFSPR